MDATLGVNKGGGGGWRSRVINYYVYPTVGEVSGIF